MFYSCKRFFLKPTNFTWFVLWLLPSSALEVFTCQLLYLLLVRAVLQALVNVSFPLHFWVLCQYVCSLCMCTLIQCQTSCSCWLSDTVLSNCWPILRKCPSSYMPLCFISAVRLLCFICYRIFSPVRPIWIGAIICCFARGLSFPSFPSPLVADSLLLHFSFTFGRPTLQPPRKLLLVLLCGRALWEQCT